jgi:hypothetical protein
MISRTSYVGAFISCLMFTSSLSSLRARGVAMARFSGTWTDDSGAVLVGANVQAKNPETDCSWSTVTDSGRGFAVADLPIGPYDVRASNPGFDPVVRSTILLTVGADPVIDFTLKVGQTRQDVIVIAQVSRAETQTGAVSSLVNSEQLPRMLRIRKLRNGEVIFTLSGRMDYESTVELENLIEAEMKAHRIVVDIKNPTLVG